MLFVVVVALPSAVSVMPAVSEHIGPQSYEPPQEFVGLGPKILSRPTGAKSKPESLEIHFSYRMYSRSASFLFATSPDSTAGVQISTDNLGSIYLTLGSSQPYDYQLLRISDPIPLNEWSEIFIFINLNQDLIQVMVDGKTVQVQEIRPERYFKIHDVEFENTEVSLGGLGAGNFPGGIRDFTLTYERSPRGINLINLKIFVSLILGLVLLNLGKRSSEAKP